ncbi:MAG: hypothetical protein EG826_04125 [Deltaproteobacteria bacterium]|nr:hypothetical protein [Deltaproteobacteria bacterium]
MYKLGERIIKEGLSPVSRILLGAVSAIFGLIMVATASGAADPFFATMIGAFCFAVTLACATWGRVRQFVGSLIGVALFGLSLVYLWSQMTGGPFFWGSRSEPSVLNAVLFVIFLGIPGITYAVAARFGLHKTKP